VARKYLFADESGNFDFRDHSVHRGATRYFAVGTLMTEGDDAVQGLRAGPADAPGLARNGSPHHGAFHCTEDSQDVRNAVFDVLQNHEFKVDVTILEKAKAQPQTRVSNPTFYQYAWFYHFKYFANSYFRPEDELMVVSAALGTKATRAAFRTAVESVVRQCCSWTVRTQFGHWEAATDPALQAVDYVLWAVMRDVERGDKRSRRLIEDKIASVYDLWSWGRTYYYGPSAQTNQTA
jgi:hypothetical protein